MSQKYYKVLLGNKSCHGGDQVWPLPTADGPGEWVEYTGGLVPCSRGLHVTTSPTVWYDRFGLSVYEAEVEGETIACGDDKFVCCKVRLVRLLSEAELAEHAIFLSGHHIVKSGLAKAFGSSRVEARDSSSVEAWGFSRVEAWDSSRVVAWDSSRVVARDSSSVVAWDYSSVVAWDSSSVVARGFSSVENYSQTNKIALEFLAIQTDRSQPGEVVIRHAPGAAVTLEPAEQPQE